METINQNKSNVVSELTFLLLKEIDKIVTIVGSKDKYKIFKEKWIPSNEAEKLIFQIWEATQAKGSFPGDLLIDLLYFYQTFEEAENNRRLFIVFWGLDKSDCGSHVFDSPVNLSKSSIGLKFMIFGSGKDDIVPLNIESWRLLQNIENGEVKE